MDNVRKTQTNNKIISIECPICMEIYTYPLILSGCGHTMCSTCIEMMYIEQKVMTCPVCLTKTYGHPSELHKNFSLVDVLETLNTHALEAGFSDNDKEETVMNYTVFKDMDKRSSRSYWCCFK